MANKLYYIRYCWVCNGFNVVLGCKHTVSAVVGHCPRRDGYPCHSRCATKSNSKAYHMQADLRWARDYIGGDMVATPEQLLLENPNHATHVHNIRHRRHRRRSKIL